MTDGTLIDVLSTGAAPRLPSRPNLGAVLTIGWRQARVIHHTEFGIAVAFVLPLRPQDVTPEISP